MASIITNEDETEDIEYLVKIKDITGAVSEMLLTGNTSIYQLKCIIYASLTKQLQVKCTKLTLEGRDLYDMDRINEIEDITQKLITQQKTDLMMISKIQVLQEEDEISLELVSARMRCGHLMGRDSMQRYLEKITKNGEHILVCPYPECQQVWNFPQCSKIAILTQTEHINLSNQLSINLLKKYSKTCPTCKSSVMKQIKALRVYCPKCKGKEFCWNCLEPWADPNSVVSCGNQLCRSGIQLVLNVKFTRGFEVNDLQNRPNKLTIMTPEYRMCPNNNCRCILSNTQGCKHTECMFCKIKFCWICLSVYDKKWKCQGAHDYCGHIAPIQEITQLKDSTKQK